MTSTDLRTAAVQAAAGASALLSEGEREAAHQLIRLFLADAMTQYLPIEAMQVFAGACLSLAAMAADPQRLRELAAQVAVG